MVTVTKQQAEEVLAKVNEYAKPYGYEPGSSSAPALYPPGFHAESWVIAWETDLEWTWESYQFNTDEVWTEPVNHWSIQILSK